MKLKHLLENINKAGILSLQANPETEVTDLCYDSRCAVSGCAFFAVRGFESDGHKYIANAVNSGAAVVICEEIPAVEIQYVLVKNARLALALMSCAFFGYPSRQMKVIGVTGTSGKTTSTHLIKHILEEALHEKVGLIGTNGNMIGDRELHTEHTTPESYEVQKLFREMVDEGCTYAVMEVSSHALVLDRVAGTEFFTGAYTNLSQDHLDFHLTMDAYAEAKSLLFRMCKNACINRDDRYADVMINAAKGANCRIITTALEPSDTASAFTFHTVPDTTDHITNTANNFGANSAPDLAASGLTFTASYVGFSAVLKEPEQTVSVKLAIPGLFSVYNALTALSVCMTCGVTVGDAAAALATAKGVKGRVESVPVDGDYTVLIDYSHKPDALEKVLKTLRPVTKGRLVCLFGCGGDRDRVKRPIMGRVACENADVVIVTSDNPRTEDPDAIIAEILKGTEGFPVPVRVITDRVEAIHWALDNACKDDVILLAGKGHEDYQVVGHEKHHMDEREIVADHLRERREKRAL